MARKFACLLTITGSKKLIDQFAQRAEGMPLAYRGDPPIPLRWQALSFNALVPVPLNRIRRRYTQRSNASVNDSGRDWELENWGCPRGAMQSTLSRENGRLIYLFIAQGERPAPFLKSVSTLFPRLNFFCVTVETRTGNTFEDR